MSQTLQQRPAFLDEVGYLPRVMRHDGRAIEEALAGPTLFDRGVRLEAAVVEATYAVEDPPLVKRLREEGVPRLIEPQTLRFTGERYLTVAQFEQLPYRPDLPITADSLTPSGAEDLARHPAVLGPFESRLGRASVPRGIVPDSPPFAASFGS
ncbi:MAG: hypothetical protein ACRDN8_09365 [Thermoleophilaceae bacterium]